MFSVFLDRLRMQRKESLNCKTVRAYFSRVQLRKTCEVDAVCFVICQWETKISWERLKLIQ